MTDPEKNCHLIVTNDALIERPMTKGIRARRDANHSESVGRNFRLG